MKRRFMAMLLLRAEPRAFRGRPRRDDCRTARLPLRKPAAEMPVKPCYDAARGSAMSADRQSSNSPGAALSRRARGGKAAAGGGRHQRLHGAHWPRPPASAPFIFPAAAWPPTRSAARPRHQHHGRRAHRRPPHHRRLLAPAAGRYRHRLGRRLQYRAHHPLT